MIILPKVGGARGSAAAEQLPGQARNGRAMHTGKKWFYPDAIRAKVEQLGGSAPIARTVNTTVVA